MKKIACILRRQMQPRRRDIRRAATATRTGRSIAEVFPAKPAPRVIPQSYFTTKSLMRLHGALHCVLTNLLQIVDQFIDIVVLL